MTKSRQTTNEEILSEHLPYELSMLRATYERLRSPINDVVICNALIESFCIHARLLLEFFENRKGKAASDFTGGNYIAAHLSGLKKSDREKLNTQITHITGKRTGNSAEKIEHTLREKLLTALENEATHFEGKLAPEFRKLFKHSGPKHLSMDGSRPSATNTIAFVATSSS